MQSLNVLLLGTKREKDCSGYHYRMLLLSCYPAEVSRAEVNGMCQNQKNGGECMRCVSMEVRESERRQQKRSLALILWCVLSTDEPQDELLCFICDLEHVGNVSDKIHYLDV